MTDGATASAPWPPACRADKQMAPWTGAEGPGFPSPPARLAAWPPLGHQVGCVGAQHRMVGTVQAGELCRVGGGGRWAQDLRDLLGVDHAFHTAGTGVTWGD